eukprot:3795242-Pleurochrysis_carterae.AAC.3
MLTLGATIAVVSAAKRLTEVQNLALAQSWPHVEKAPAFCASDANCTLVDPRCGRMMIRAIS